MNIEMINNHSANRMVDVDKSQYGNPSSTDSRMKTKEMGYSLDITGKVMENAAYGKDELKSAQDIALEAGKQNVTLQRNYAAVMSNSMSAEDYAELTKDGIDPTNTKVTESVTNLDKIKIKMAEAGITIVGYNDDLTEEEISKVVGNSGLAASITSAVSGADIPVNAENIEAMEDVLTLSTQIGPMNDDAVKYMLVNDLEPTVENIYKAEYSSGKLSDAGFTEESVSWDDIKDQAVEIAKKADVETDKAIEDAKWLVTHNVPLTEETIEKYDELQSLELPIEKEDLLKAMTIAITEGKEAKEANLLQKESIYEKAVAIVNDFSKLENGGDLTKRRQLEEIRLAMTAEANLVLLKKGIQIDTQPLEKLVEQLKEAEKEFYRPLLLDEDEESLRKELSDENEVKLSERIDLYKAARSVVKELPEIPVEAIAVSGEESENDFTLNRVHELGVAAKAVYDKAGESYEALMTAPRSDMGDSIKKAFTNVDDILEDLGIDINDSNRKAVRTLGYAQMEINAESIERIREATNAVKAVVTMMTPAKVMSLIKEGHNPLNENIYDLEKSLAGETVEETAEKYSRYLWKLEKSGQITEDEKNAYIGMYRLFNQIEKNDGKVIGNVLANGMELTMQNMLAAARSNRSRNMDARIDDDFGTLEEIVAKGDSISEQISKGFVKMMDEEISRDYISEKLKDIQRASKVSQSAEAILKEIDIPVTVANILAVSDMSSFGNNTYKKMFGNNVDSDKKAYTDRIHISDEVVKEGASAVPVLEEGLLSDNEIDRLLDDFNDSKSARDAYEKFIIKASDMAEEQINKAESFIQAREWTFAYKQLSVAAALGRKETYDIPVRTKDGVTSIHLTINSKNDESGKVTAEFETERYGKVSARFAMKENGLDGFITTDSRAGLEELEGIKESLVHVFEENGVKTENLSIVYGRNVQYREYLSDINNSEATNKGLYTIAKTFIVALSE